MLGKIEDFDIYNMESKKVLIVGFSTTGIAAAKYLHNKGFDVFITEKNEFAPKNQPLVDELTSKGIKIEFGTHSDDFIDNVNFAILSPSVPPEAEILEKLKQRNISYFSDVEFCSFFDRNKMIAITGTNGKTTTTALTSFILSKKYNAPYCGNIGISPMEYLDKSVDFYVIEASSYQLYYSKSFAPKIGVFCNLTPDHILWHKTLDNYFEAKAMMFRNMDENSCAILNYDDELTKKLGSEINAKVYYFSLSKKPLDDKQVNRENLIYLDNNKIIFNNEEIININELQIVGLHNIQNAMCAILCAILSDVEIETIRTALKEFRAIEHRLEFIRSIQGTDYYNDSKATNPEASIVAINSFPGKKVVLIAGGRDKKTSLADFIESIKKNVSKVVLIGEATQRFREELSRIGYLNIVNSKTLEEAIDIASLDKPNVVLLSPACASFDMFESYEKRGDAFRKYVLSKK